MLSKDVRALIRSAEQQGFDSQILRAVEARNARQKELLFETLGELFQGRWQGRTVALWGWPSPGTDDLREAPSLVLLEALLRHGVRVRPMTRWPTPGSRHAIRTRWRAPS